MKGGHSSAALCNDLLVQDGREVSFTAPRLKTRNTHGTGCSLSSAIAAEIAKGKTMVDAVQISHQWLQGALKKADSLNIGNGHGPVHHFHEFWS
jgi:hydroxymethylpyrimidine/phosphomethylpyrimidine kinase